MDHTVYISKEIKDNDDGTVDEIVSSIHSAPEGSRLVCLITSVGGNTFQGDRLYHAIKSHKGPTYGLVIGAAISMAASLAPAFDTFEIDEGAEFMLHSARPSNGEGSSQSDRLIENFNDKTKNRFKEMGANPDFIDSVFDDGNDHWLTPDQVEKYGIGKKVKLNRNAYKGQFDLAAKWESKINKMNLLKKKRLHQVNLADGSGAAVFESKNENLSVGDTLRMIGDASLSNSITLEGGIKASLDSDGEVTKIENIEPSSESVSKEEFDALSAKVAEMERMVMEFMGKEETTVENSAKDKEEIVDKINEAVSTANEAIENAMTVAKGIKSTFEIPKMDDKSEIKAVSQLDGSIGRMQELRDKLNKVEKGN